MKQKCLLWLLYLALLPSFCLADMLCLPEGTTEIAEEAFAGCARVTRVVIPDSVSSIAANAFDGCSEALLLQCGADSAALAYARSNQFDYQATDTVYRALLIGQTYRNVAGAFDVLYGPLRDVSAMSSCLEGMPGTPFQITVKKDLSVSKMKSAILEAFADATDRDVSLFYYSGHGGEDGSLVGATLIDIYITPEALRQTLDQVPGRKVIIVDACYSGALIANDGEAKSNPARAFVSSFVNAFSAGGSGGSSRRSRGALNDSQYFVLTAAQAYELSWEKTIPGSGSSDRMGVFTHFLCKGCGWLAPSGQTCPLYADANEDGAVSVQEAFAYAAPLARELSGGYHEGQWVEQNAAVWPAGCTWFAPFRWQ